MTPDVNICAYPAWSVVLVTRTGNNRAVAGLNCDGNAVVDIVVLATATLESTICSQFK